MAECQNNLLISQLDSQRKRYRIIILNDIWVEYSIRFVSFHFKFSFYKTDSTAFKSQDGALMHKQICRLSIAQNDQSLP